jgi:hypothetical protein
VHSSVFHDYILQQYKAVCHMFLNYYPKLKYRADPADPIMDPLVCQEECYLQILTKYVWQGIL